jgi:hypothetical protein
VRVSHHKTLIAKVGQFHQRAYHHSIIVLIVLQKLITLSGIFQRTVLNCVKRMVLATIPKYKSQEEELQ